ncbi:MAG: hypothetical protein PHX44_06545 [Sulfurimonas sp.]|uniref:hypothetical protein n=1 Tax=Sulfurimonas sp. TaxID=2022749 RepID=UPI0026283495|nr:hypothetical protein [Sulfurimonas sp.]MDD2652690.1 hypothetical protein [Sulfurimonas sp.]MDD3450857.1 hypothetical protein [Sulfurimonas sp.]
MQVTSDTALVGKTKGGAEIKPLFTERISKDEAKEIKEQIQKSANEMAFKSASVQSALFRKDDAFAKEYDEFQTFLQDIGYDGKPIAELSQEEASALVSEDGFFGVAQTSQRIADFVINGAGGDEKMLRAGREGMLRGFKEAEEMWGGKLPEISQETMKKALEMVDKAIYDLGFSVLDTEA